MKQRALALFLALGLTLSLSACGGGDEPSPAPADSAPPASTQPVETGTPDPSETPEETESVEPSEEPSEQPSQEPSAAPSEKPSASPSQKPSASPSPAPSSKPSDEPSVSPVPSAPAETPSPAPTPSAPAETPAPTPSAPAETPDAPDGSVDLAAFAETLLADYEFSGFLTLAEGELAEGFYPGLTAVETNQSLVYICQMSMNTGELVLVEVKDSADVDAVKAILQARIDNMINGGAWYPEPTEIWTNSSRVVSNGNYVMMVVNPACDDIVAAFDALF